MERVLSHKIYTYPFGTVWLAFLGNLFIKKNPISISVKGILMNVPR